jgi:hypothetical protein
LPVSSAFLCHMLWVSWIQIEKDDSSIEDVKRFTGYRIAQKDVEYFQLGMISDMEYNPN